MKITLEVFFTGISCWYKNHWGYLHREDEHPAVIYIDGSKEYFIDGQITKIVRPDNSVIHLDKRRKPVYNKRAHKQGVINDDAKS